MNDRPQGGSADLTDNSTIELIQNRRILRNDDNPRIRDNLNDTDINGNGIKVNARYYM